MGALDFLSRRHDVSVLHYNHGTEHAQLAEAVVIEQCFERKITCAVGYNRDKKPSRASNESWWREQRYAFLDQFRDRPIVTCHHLDDCVETWVWSSMHGTGKWIPYRRNNIVRPFRLTRKQDFKNWAIRHNVAWIEDESNSDIHYTRNYVRHEMMPHVLRVNPGIHKTIAKKIKENTNGL